MSILAADVKLYKSQEMNDNDTGGGVITSTEVADGTSGDIFPAISRLDKSGGKLNLRKIFAKIDSDNDDLYSGAHAILTSLSTDTYVSEFIVDSEVWERGDISSSDLLSDEGRTTSLTTLASGATAGDVTIAVASAADLSIGSIYTLYEYAVPILTEQVLVIGISGTTITLSNNLTNDYALGEGVFLPSVAGSRGYGVAAVKSSAASGQKDIELNTLSTPSSGATTGAIGIGLFYAGDTVLLIEGATTEICTIDSITKATITVLNNLANTFTTAAVCCSVYPLGDLQADKGVDFTQETWDGTTFSDTQSGSAASGTYNFASYPLSVDNHDSITDRIGLDFTSSTAFNIISERYGNLGTGSTSAAVAPLNPLTADPYFSLSASGWGGTWQSGNVLRFNVIGAMKEIWLARSIIPGCTGTGSDGTDIELRGDV